MTRQLGLDSILSAIELREIEVLHWGGYDVASNREEIEVAISTVENDVPVDEVINALIRRGALLPVPEKPGLYRTRMAETVRVLATVRQWFSSRPWWSSPELMLDFRILHRQRRRPKRDVDAERLIDAAARGLCAESAVALKAITPRTVSEFQRRSAQVLRDSLDVSRDSAVVVAAGTGSGKSLAFYLPVIAEVIHAIHERGVAGVQVLAVYPRTELLKDQLSTVLKLNNVLAQEGLPARTRPLRVGAWLGAVPKGYFKEGPDWSAKRQAQRLTGWICPFLKCLECDGDLEWKKEDYDKSLERLICTNKDCNEVISENQISLTRESLIKNPPDFMLTTTESLNRQLASPASWPAFGLGEQGSLRTVLLDEAHTYEGTTGAQVAYLLRRVRFAAANPLVWCGLSATLLDARPFFSDLTKVAQEAIAVVEPEPADLEESGAEYLLGLRHNPSSNTGPLTATIQTIMALERMLDVPIASQDIFARNAIDSEGMFGSITFVFTDKLDVTNRLFWDVLDSEGRVSESFLRTGRSPLTLAHLRSRDQQKLKTHQDPPQNRDPSGQWWWFAEQLGWPIGKDVPLRVGRTSSQDQGVSDSDVIIATAALEVGFDDPAVGAVVQHRAPRSAATFLQRKGRAGRSIAMRPWTVVVLSGWGRDALAWKSYDQLFDPQLAAARLPLSNRYVLRMQAVYAMLDWVGREAYAKGLVPEGWATLTEPKRFTNAQDKLESLLNEVLLGGFARDRLVQYLERSLGISREEVEVLLWTPPRSLLLAVVPTAHRRLEHHWAGESASNSSARFTPLQEFIAGNLFGALLTPEVRITIPGGRNSGGEASEEMLPALRVLREFLPGNVTRHFGVYADGKRHWVEPPSTTTVDVAAYGGSYLRTLPKSEFEEEVRIYRPTAVTLSLPPMVVKDSSKVSPVWEVSIDSIGLGSVVQSPPSWAELIPEIRFHLHADGAVVQVCRYTRSAVGWRREGSDRNPVHLSFSDGRAQDEGSAAIGIELDVDAMSLEVKLPRGEQEIGPLDRSLYLRGQIESSNDFSSLDWMGRHALYRALLFLIADFGGAKSVLELSDYELRGSVERAIQRLNFAPDGPEGEDHGEKTPQRVDLEDEDLLRGVRRALSEANSPVDASEWAAWHEKRFAVGIAEIILQAAGQVVESFEASEIAVDVVLNGESATIWFTETSPGGNGLIESLYAHVINRPVEFWKAVRSSAQPGEFELLDRSLTNIVTGQVEGIDDAIESLRTSWSNGHDAANLAISELRKTIESENIGNSNRSVVSYLATRVSAPGAPRGLRSGVRSLLQAWTDLEASTSFAFDSWIIGEICSSKSFDEPSLQTLLESHSDPLRHPHLLAALLWPRSLDAVEQLELSGQHFDPLPIPAMEVVRQLLPKVAVVSVAADEVATDVLNEVVGEEKVVSLSFSSTSQARRAILDLLEQPIEVDLLLIHPQISGLRMAGTETIVELSAMEAER